MAAKKKEIREIAAQVSAPSGQMIERVYMPLKTKQAQMLGSGDAKAGAAELVEKLRGEAGVI